MPVSTNAFISPQAIKVGSARCVAAKTTFADLVNAVPLFQAGANGARIVRVTAMPCMTVTACQLMLWYTDQAGALAIAKNSLPMAAFTMGPTVAVPYYDFGYSEDYPLYLKPNDQLYCSTGVAFATNGVAFTAEGMDY
jgi:hypothetical protein